MNRAAPDISSEIAGLKQMSVDELAARWRSTFGRKPPAHLPRYILINILAYQIQADEFGELGKDQVRYLDAIGKGGGRATSMPAPGQASVGEFRVGTMFVREHEGTTHHVTVASEGLVWSGNVYSSLSAVARAITGTNWNGRRFFGLPNSGKADR